MSGTSTGRRLLAYLRPYVWPYFVGALLCMTAYSATAGIVPFLVHSLVDKVFQAGDNSVLRILPAVIAATFVVRAAVNFGQAYLGEYVGQHIVFDLRRGLDERIQHLPIAYFDKVASSGILSRVTTDVLLVREALTEGVAAMIRDTTTVLVLLVVALYLDHVLAFVTLVVFPSVVLPLQRLSRRMRRLSREGLDTLGALAALLQETILGNRVVKAFGMEGYEKARFSAENTRLLGLYMRAAKIKAFTTPLMEVAAAVGIAATLWIGGASVIGGERTAGDFMAFLTALVLLYEPFKKVVRTNNILQTGLGAAERIFELMDIEPEPAGLGGSRLGGFSGRIRFEGVSFAYGEERVVHNVDLELAAGQTLALVGPSGGGKSTLADLIPRFYEVDSGRITIDGRDLREIETASLRGLMSVVTQFTFLFNDSVRNNIAYGRPGTADEDVVEAAKAANADEFIRGLPRGYDTVVGELGVQLSGGQRQRVAIARALLKNAPILILDEATSALDSESERLVQAAVEALMEGRTTLVIAHRFSTVRRADRIAVIAGGRVIESGTHEELLEGGEVYKRLHDMQFRDDAP